MASGAGRRERVNRWSPSEDYGCFLVLSGEPRLLGQVSYIEVEQEDGVLQSSTIVLMNGRTMRIVRHPVLPLALEPPEEDTAEQRTAEYLVHQVDFIDDEDTYVEEATRPLWRCPWPRTSPGK